MLRPPAGREVPLHATPFAVRTLKTMVASLLLAGAFVGISRSGVSASTCVDWSGVQPPSPGTSDNFLTGVAMLSSCNAWAVGTYSNGPADQSLVLHWNGTAWKQMASPDPDGTGIFHAVAATSANNAWAVGDYSNGTAAQTLISRWDGTKWTKVNSPNPAGSARDNVLLAVAATSANDAWAVGYYNSSGGGGRTFILRWNGFKWTQATSPNPKGSSGDSLNAVAATSANDAWAVGSYFNGTADQTLILRWNGSKWEKVTSPDPGGSSRYNDLQGVAATSANDAWAVGFYYNDTTDQTLILRWNGTKWSKITSPDPAGSSHSNELYGVAATSANDAWVVGYYNDGSLDRNLALHCC